MSKYDLLLFINAIGKGDYPRLRTIERSGAFNCKAIYLEQNIRISASHSDIQISQRRRSVSLSDYSLIHYWPSSFQQDRFRLGYHHFKRAGDDFLRRSWAVLEEGIMLRCSDRMVSSYQASKAAANKVYLQAITQPLSDLDLREVVTNDGPLIDQTHRSFRTPIGKVVCDTNEVTKGLYAFPFFMSAPPPADQIDPQPLIVQEFADLAEEFRLYCFGDQHIALHLQQAARTPSDPIDKRLVKGELPCEMVDEPSLSLALRKLRSALSIDLFSADILRDPDGRIAIIDVNPHGSWHWMPAEICDTLDNLYVEYLVQRCVLNEAG